MKSRNSSRSSVGIADTARKVLRKTKRHKVLAATPGARAKANIKTLPPPVIRGEVISRPKVGRLKTLAHWRKEMSRVYRQMRRYEIEPEIGTKLAYVATQGAKMCKDEEELQELRAIHAQVSAINSGRPLPALPAPNDDEAQS